MGNLQTVRKSETDSDEWLSALFDGELGPDESRRELARIGQDAEASRLWSEYSLIGDVMRGCEASPSGFTDRFSAVLAEEPTVLAPMPAARPSPRTYYWMAAAAAVAAITWGVISVAPEPGGAPAIPVAANEQPAMEAAMVSDGEVQALLAAHQDYAYAMVADPEMRYTRVSYQMEGR